MHVTVCLGVIFKIGPRICGLVKLGAARHDVTPLLI